MFFTHSLVNCHLKMYSVVQFEASRVLVVYECAWWHMRQAAHSFLDWVKERGRCGGRELNVGCWQKAIGRRSHIKTYKFHRKKTKILPPVVAGPKDDNTDFAFFLYGKESVSLWYLIICVIKLNSA